VSFEGKEKKNTQGEKEKQGTTKRKGGKDIN
jgi:hypothetical protein